MRQAKLTSKGQITIPKSIRDFLKLHTGDKVRFILDKGGRVILTAQTLDIKDSYGAYNYKSTKKKTTIEDMDKAIGKAITRKYLRASRRH